MITHPPRDTIRLDLQGGRGTPCGGGGAMLLQALTPAGEGVLVRLRYHDSLASGAYPLRGPGDTTTPGSIGAVRYLVRDVPHAFLLDSGSFTVTRRGNSVSALARTSGLENAVRVHAAIEYEDISLGGDTVSCRDGL